MREDHDVVVLGRQWPTVEARLPAVRALAATLPSSGVTGQISAGLVDSWNQWDGVGLVIANAVFVAFILRHAVLLAGLVNSLVKGLLARGEDVYIIDWGYPDRSDKYLTLEDYIERFIGGAVDYLRKAHKQDAINLLGICQGGVFSLCYAALHPRKVRNLITMVTPVDFHTEGNMLANWTRGMDVDLMVDTLGNVPADMMNFTYLQLKPWRLFVQKYVGLVDILDNKQALEDFLRMEKWIFDSPDQAGEAFRQFIKQFYQRNGFIKGGIEIGGEAVDLGFVDMPVLNIYAEQDHLVPPDASRALRGRIGSSDYTESSFRGGHIGIYVSGRAQREVPGTITDWLKERSA